MTPEDLIILLRAPESEHVEFKEAKTQFDLRKLMDYCVALANEEGGVLVLGVSDKTPRTVVGTNAFRDLPALKGRLLDAIGLRIDIHEYSLPERVVVFEVPSRPRGRAIHHDGRYLMRSGERLVPMTPETLFRIQHEDCLDFSALICSGANFSDLHPDAIRNFQEKWCKKSGKEEIRQSPPEQLLENAELLVDGQVTYAALILLGTAKAMGRHVPQAELIHEYRAMEESIPALVRRGFREGYFLFLDDLWDGINRYNIVHPYQAGLFRMDIPSFRESVIREGILNAICHRDYRHQGSIFVRQYPERIEITSPGGFPPGITKENILDRHRSRNRRIAEAVERCGLVERAGQGVDLMFNDSIRDGKLPPDFSGSDDHQVTLSLHGAIRDAQFPRFLENISQEKHIFFGTKDYIVLDLIRREKVVPSHLHGSLTKLIESGAVERHGRRCILSRRFYALAGQTGLYTRRRGLDHGVKKALLLQHLQTQGASGGTMSEFLQIFPELTRKQIITLLHELRDEGQISLSGKTRSAVWRLTEHSPH